MWLILLTGSVASAWWAKIHLTTGTVAGGLSHRCVTPGTITGGLSNRHLILTSGMNYTYFCEFRACSVKKF